MGRGIKVTAALSGIVWLLLVLMLAGCEAVPSPGDRFVMVVTRMPTRRQDLQWHPGFSLAIERGVTREDVTSGRLLITGCYVEPETPGGLVRRRHGYVLIPEGTAVKEGDIVEIAAEEADGAEGAFSRYFGRYLGGSAAAETDYFPYKYATDGREFRCGAVAPDGAMRVEVYGTAAFWDYDLSAAEAARNRQITDAELQAGRIAMGECSPGVDSWVRWKVRIPAGLALKVGDYIQVAAGSREAPRSVGPLSTVLRRVAKPPKEDFILTLGSMTVSCGARAAALDTE